MTRTVWPSGARHLGSAVAAVMAVGFLSGGPTVSPAAAEPVGALSEFPVSGQPFDITAGPDGNLWFTECGAKKVGRITPAGVVTEFPVPSCPREIVSGPDGALWFTETVTDRIGRITTSGTVFEFSVGIPAGASPWGITSDPWSGAVWFTEPGIGMIGRIDTTTWAVVQSQPEALPAGTLPYDILAVRTYQNTTAFYYTDLAGDDSIVSAGTTPDGSAVAGGVREPAWIGQLAGFTPGRPTIGPDGSILFANQNQASNTRIWRDGRHVPSVTGSPGVTGGSSGMAAGPDGAMWFVSVSSPNLVRLSPPSSLFPDERGYPTLIPVPALGSGQLARIAAGPDGAMWFTEPLAKRIGRVTTGVNPAMRGPGLAGTGQVGTPLVCGGDVWAMAPESMRLTWTRDATAIAGSTDLAYTPTASDVGAVITCQSRVRLPAVLPELVATSNPVVVIPAPADGASGLPGAPGAPGPAAAPPVVGLFAAGPLTGRTGSTIKAVYAVSQPARVTLTLARKGTEVTKTVNAHEGANTTTLRLETGRKDIPTGTYALRLATAGSTLGKTKVRVLR